METASLTATGTVTVLPILEHKVTSNPVCSYRTTAATRPPNGGSVSTVSTATVTA